MHITTYLNFDGNCEEAFKFYEQVLGGKILMMTRYEGTPAANHSPSEMRNKILHARIQIGDTVLMGSDVPPGQVQPQGFGLSLGVDKVAEADLVFNALAGNGEVSMPMGKTFFAERFGMLRDSFGVSWMVVCEKEI